MPPIDKKAAQAKGKRAALALARRLPLEPLAAHGGTAGRPVVLTQARLLILRDDAWDQGIRLLDKVPPDALGATGHALLGWAHLSLGRLDRAEPHARAAVDAAADPDAEAIGLAMAVAERGRWQDLRVTTQRLASTTTPRTTRDADRLVGWFATDDAQRATDFTANARSWSVPFKIENVEVIEHVSAISGETDRDSLLAAAERIGRSGPSGFRAASRVLGDIKEWDALRDLFLAVDLDSVAALPPKTLASLAAKASRSGWLDTAEVISGRALRITRHKDSKAINDQAADQIHISRTGWPVDDPQPATYQPRPRAVLSVLAQSLPHRGGGYATRSHGILTGLRGLGWDMLAATRLGFPYDFWAPKDPRVVPERDEVDGLTYVRLLEPGEREYRPVPLAGYIDRFADRLAEVATEHQASLIHASSFQNNGLAGLRAARRLGIPFVYEMRGLEDLMKVSRNPDFARTDAYRYMTGLELHVVQQADLTFVITEALREEMIRRGGPADRIVVLPNGVHTSQFEPREPDAALIAELGLEGKMIVGYAGGLVDYEGLDLLLYAAAELKAERDDFAVIIVGDGHHESALHRLARELDVLDVVTFTGRVPHSEVARYLSIFQVTPFPRLPLPVCELISPIKPFESMAMGKACITSSVAALTEIVTPDERGLVFEKGDAGSLAGTIRRYLDDPELRDRMGRQAREWVLAERDWSDVTRIVDEQYHRLLD